MAEIDKPLPNVDIKDEAFVETEVETLLILLNLDFKPFGIY